MEMKYTPGRTNFGLLPEPEGRSASFITSAVINGVILALILLVGLLAHRQIVQHQIEESVLIAPTTPPPPQVKVKLPPPPPMPPPPNIPEMHFEAPKIQMPHEQPKPALKEIQMEARMQAPVMKAAGPAVILAPQPKAALTAAAPAQEPQQHVSTAAVHLGETFGVRPNPNANRPATIAALGNPYGGMRGPSAAPRGVVGSTGIGNGTRSGSNYGTVGRVASAGIPGSTGSGPGEYRGGRVASAGIPGVVRAAATPQMSGRPSSTELEVLSKPPVRYTTEARQAHVQGDVVLRVTFLASGRVVVDGVVHGLGHGLDEEARREAEQIRFKPATRDGRPVDLTTNITITFQLA